MPRVTVVCHDSPTRDTCPTLYRTEEGALYVQGYVVSDADVLAQMSVPVGEAVVQITPELLRLILETGPSVTGEALQIAAAAAPAEAVG